ncbi:endolytic transglycosylase MltG [Arcanobacterium bovis]|uniref:Endolytic murein transglycosylase n=1 Tax=Arcanobacterium bovis TaxID=2529275 RepID=A0A4Q9V2V7_9ACTO|nr:endolytic transglycosylase MltG [Arcanobacterium bovis]TBW22908.1 endolytic transglycosylase MltG [Arcanobacterium bovis]
MTDFFAGDENRVNDSSRNARKRSRRRRRQIRSAAFLALVTGLVVFAAVVSWPYVSSMFSSTSEEDFTGSGTESVVITIPKGASGSAIGKILEEKGVVASQSAFVEAFNANPRSGSIQPGSYALKKKISGADAVAALLDPASKAEIKVTIPEGFTVKQVKDRLVNVLGVEQAAVDKAASDTASLGLPAEAKGNLEGWIPPLTYTFAPGTNAQEALKQMVAKRVKELESSGIARDQWERQIIVASIVQREVSWSDHYAQVARVIENRLNDKSQVHGYLQMDSTVMYGVGKTSGIPTNADIQNDNPYNTYKHPGLPAGPISSPSIDVIKATVNPPAGDWLYFVTVNLDTGETKFSNSLEEHNKNVQEFRQWYAANKK